MLLTALIILAAFVVGVVVGIAVGVGREMADYVDCLE
jgi:uncharacterized integral membrane protein